MSASLHFLRVWQRVPYVPIWVLEITSLRQDGFPFAWCDDKREYSWSPVNHRVSISKVRLVGIGLLV